MRRLYIYLYPNKNEEISKEEGRTTHRDSRVQYSTVHAFLPSLIWSSSNVAVSENYRNELFREFHPPSKRECPVSPKGPLIRRAAPASSHLIYLFFWPFSSQEITLAIE